MTPQKASRGQVDPDKRLPQPKTRDRILQAARELFNERGEANVTLALIGEHLGISEGNVWYHFHTKHDLILTLFTQLQAQIKVNQQVDLDQVGQAEQLLTRSFRMIWDYRFLFRDHINWAVAQSDVHQQMVTLTVQGQAFIERVLERLCQLELLDLPKGESPRLATNIWIITRYWIDYCQAKNTQRQITEQDLQEGIDQVRALFSPYLTAEGQAVLNRSKAGIATTDTEQAS